LGLSKPKEKKTNQREWGGVIFRLGSQGRLHEASGNIGIAGILA